MVFFILFCILTLLHFSFPTRDFWTLHQTPLWSFTLVIVLIYHMILRIFFDAIANLLFSFIFLHGRHFFIMDTKWVGRRASPSKGRSPQCRDLQSEWAPFENSSPDAGKVRAYNLQNSRTFGIICTLIIYARVDSVWDLHLVENPSRILPLPQGYYYFHLVVFNLIFHRNAWLRSPMHCLIGQPLLHLPRILRLSLAYQLVSVIQSQYPFT